MWPTQRLFRILAIVGGLAACAHDQVGTWLPSVDPICRFGRDYGSGMVALGLPPSAHWGYVLAHETLIDEISDVIWLQDRDGEPYSPHVSLIYGVDEENRPAIAASLEKQAQLYESVFIELGDLAFWDLGDTGKTALVATIRDREGHLAALHQALQPLTGRLERYPYQPHITIAYLVRGARPLDETLNRLRVRLTALNTKARVAWLTDRCGLSSGYEALGGGIQGSPLSNKNFLPPSSDRLIH